MKTEQAMCTYNQFLQARALAEVLLIKHGEECAAGKAVTYADIQVDEAFERLSKSLGRTEAARQVVGASL